MIKKFNFSYDKENDDLFLFHPHNKSKGSIELGNLVFDFDKKKELVGLEILDASKTIVDLIEKKKASMIELLENLKECKIENINKDNLLIIKLSLTSKTQTLTPIFCLPSIQEPSPSLKVD